MLCVLFVIFRIIWWHCGRRQNWPWKMVSFSASLLLDSLLSYLTSNERVSCKAVYLHVLATNSIAIRFYQRRSFHPHSFLPFYYSIQGKPRDGYSYVLYINGGQPPWSLIYPLLLHWLRSVRALCCYTGCGQPGHFAAMLAVVSRGTLLPMPSSKREQGSHTVVNSYWDKLMLG